MFWRRDKCREAEHTDLLAQIIEIASGMAYELNSHLSQMEQRIMSALTDAVNRITNSTKAEIAAVIARLNEPSPDVDAAVTALNALSDSLDAETAALTPAPAAG